MANLLQPKRGETLTELFQFIMEECCNCGIPFMFSSSKKKELLSSKETFFCPNGHAQHYTGKSEAEKLQDKLNQMEREKEEQIKNIQNLLMDKIDDNHKLTKQLKRLHKGVCPCCNRSFVNLQQHMKKQHPDKIIA